MRSLTLIGCLALVLESCTSESAFDPDTSTVLSGAQATNLELCLAPSINDVWNPSELQIAELEEHLFATLTAELHQRELDTVRGRDYFRQYLGFMAGSRRIIYVSGFHRSHIERLAEGQQKLGFRLHGADWRHEAICAIDGGPTFFSAEYDVGGNVLRNFAFNPSGG